VFAVACTFIVLFLTQKKKLLEAIPTDIEADELSSGGKVALTGIILTVLALLIASALDLDLGLPTAIAGFSVVLMITVFTKKSPVSVLKNISWSVLPLVAGLFIMVEALSEIGLVESLTKILAENSAKSVSETAWFSGISTAIGCNLVNNLPAGLLVGSAAAADHIPALVKSFILIGIDLGPNLSVTGSLATILWLIEIRKHGYEITAWQFLKLGFLVMIPSLLAALGSLWLLNYFEFI
jgi:arsenical pump membrane protein